MQDLALSSNNQRVYDFLETSIQKEDIPRIRFWISNAIGALGISAGIPFVPAGKDLGGNNKLLGVFYGVTGGGINSALYAPFAKQVAEWVISNVFTPDELKALMPAKYSTKSKILLAGALGTCALLSTIDYLALGEETKSAYWITAINVFANFIAHGKAFIMAVDSDNFMFHKYVSQPISLSVRKCFSSADEVESYKQKIKADFILDDIYSAVLKHFKSMYTGNYEKQLLEDAIRAEATKLEESPDKRSTIHNVARNGIGSFITTLTFISLTGYLAAGYVVLDKYIENPFISIMLAALGNLFFLYLVGRSTFATGQSKITDSIVDINKNGFIKSLGSSNWLKMHPWLWVGILSVCLVMAAFSYPSSVDLVEKNLPLVCLASLVEFVLIVTYASAGIFNAVNVPDLGKTASEIVTFAKPERKGEGQRLLLVENQGGMEAGAIQQPLVTTKDKMKHEYLAGLSLAQISKLPKDKFLAFFVDVVLSKCEGDKNRIMRMFSDNKVSSPQELQNFLGNHLQEPGFYRNKSALYLGRVVDSIRNCGDQPERIQNLVMDHN